jgi:peptidoglycan hydrolase FlgJ
MDIGGTQVFYLNNVNNIVNDGLVDRAKNQANDVSKFEETLRRAASQANAVDTPDSEPADSRPPSSRFAKIDKTDKLYEQCVELEIFLVKNLISSMRNTVQKSNLINEGYAGKMYEDMLYDEYARDLAKNANFGLAEMAYLELTGQRGKIINNR